MYGFARRPRWIVLHCVVLLIVGLFALAGKWQLDRLHQRREHNALVRARSHEPVRPFHEVATKPFSRANVSGHYDTRNEFVLLGRGGGERSGNHVLTPLRIRDGRSVIVDRGWVPSGLDDPPVGRARPPSRDVRVVGQVVATEGSPPFAGKGALRGAISRVDLARMARGLPYPVHTSAYLMLRDQAPPQSVDLPRPIPAPPLGEGSHMSYVIQWFAFIAIALVGYATLLRREARKVRV